MFKRLLIALGGTLVVLAGAARAEVDPNYNVVLLTENFPPYNMAINGKNFAHEDNINGIAVDIVKEMFKRAGVNYSLTLRFPWDRIYKLALEKPGYGVFVTARLPEREQLFKWVGPIGPDDWIMLAKAGSKITLESLEQARKYKIGAYKGDAIAETLTKQGLAPQVVLRDQDNAKKLVAGQIDLWATGDPAGRYLARQVGVTGLKTVLRFNSAQLYLALNKDVPDETVKKLQAALDQMRKDGVVDEIMGRVSLATDPVQVADCGLVIEAVFEDLQVKGSLFQALDKVCSPRTLFASNTSTLSITEIAAVSGREDRFVGMHFCLPAQLMKLVEMSPGLATSDETFARAWEICEQLGQRPVKTQDQPGFILNCFLVPFNNDAIRLVEQGVAEPEAIDKAIKTALGYAMGPMELLDLVGLDTQVLLCEALHSITHEPRAACPPLLRRMVAARRLGRKTQRGFLNYESSKIFGS